MMMSPGKKASGGRLSKKKDVIMASEVQTIKERDQYLPNRRLSSYYHGLPSVVDFDPATGYVTFGTMIEPPPAVKHPRRYKEPVIPIVNKDQLTCWHDYCLTNRRRMYGLAVSDKPVGFPWSTGLLKHLPGHILYDYPIHKSYLPKKKKKAKPKEVEIFDSEKKAFLGEITDEMLYFYKILMLSGSVLREAKNRGDDKPYHTCVDDSPSAEASTTGRDDVSGQDETGKGSSTDIAETKTEPVETTTKPEETKAEPDETKPEPVETKPEPIETKDELGEKNDELAEKIGEPAETKDEPAEPIAELREEIAETITTLPETNI